MKQIAIILALLLISADLYAESEAGPQDPQTPLTQAAPQAESLTAREQSLMMVAFATTLQGQGVSEKESNCAANLLTIRLSKFEEEPTLLVFITMIFPLSESADHACLLLEAELGFTS